MSREAMQMALDAFDYFFPTEDGQLWHTANDVKKIDDARQALQQALETEQEPVECMCGICKLGKREWVSLTDQEVWDAIEDVLEGGGWLDVARTLEQAFKEKNT